MAQHTLARLWPALVLALLAASAWARPVTDHLGRTVDVPETIERYAVTNIYPFASASVVFLGSADKIVGMHPLSMQAARQGLLAQLWPKITDVDARFMQGPHLNIESLLALAPEVVFVNAADKRQIAQLEAAGIPAIAVSTSRWNYDVMRTFGAWTELLADVFGAPERLAHARAEQARLEHLVQSRVETIPADERARVLFLFEYDAARIVTSGRRFFGQYWAEAAGGINVAQSITAESANAIVNMEHILAWNPDVVILTHFTRAMPSDVLRSRYHDWRAVRAAKSGLVYKMPLGLYRSFTPAADSPLMLLWLAKTLYPKRFADIDLIEETVRFYRQAWGLTITPQAARALMQSPQPISR